MLLRFKAATVIATAVLAAGAAVSFAPSALAVDNQTMCVNDLAGHVQCAELDVSTGFVDSANESSSPSGVDFHWNVNTSSTAYHQISSRDTSATGCMAFLGPSLPQIEIEGCDGTAYEEWKIVATSATGQVVLQNEEFPGDCLNDHYQINEVDAAPCNDGPDEVWASYAITVESG
jgi:hypothetical protein